MNPVAPQTSPIDPRVADPRISDPRLAATAAAFDPRFTFQTPVYAGIPLSSATQPFTQPYLTSPFATSAIAAFAQPWAYASPVNPIAFHQQAFGAGVCGQGLSPFTSTSPYSTFQQHNPWQQLQQHTPFANPYQQVLMHVAQSNPVLLQALLPQLLAGVSNPFAQPAQISPQFGQGFGMPYQGIEQSLLPLLLSGQLQGGGAYSSGFHGQYAPWSNPMTPWAIQPYLQQLQSTGVGSGINPFLLSQILRSTNPMLGSVPFSA